MVEIGNMDSSPDPQGLPAMRAVAIASEGGAYDDAAFMAGWFAGCMDLILTGRLHSVPGCWSVPAAVPEPLLPQMDLIAARNDCVMVKLSELPECDVEDPPGARLVNFEHHYHETAPLIDGTGHTVG